MEKTNFSGALRIAVFIVTNTFTVTSYAQLLKVPYVTIAPNTSPMWIAEAAGLYSKHNLRIEHVYIPGGSVIIQAMLSGDVKIANLAPVSAITAWTKGADLALVATHVTRSELTVVTTARLGKIEDLKGKRIGVSRFGSITDVALREAHRFYQLYPERDVIILQTGSQGARLASLKAGSLDAAVSIALGQATKLTVSQKRSNGDVAIFMRSQNA